MCLLDSQLYYNYPRKLTSNVVRTLLNSLAQTLDVTSQIINGKERTPLVMTEITKDTLVDICTRSGHLFSRHIRDFDVLERCFVSVFDLLHAVDSTLDSLGHWNAVRNELKLLENLFVSMAYLGVAYSVILCPCLVDPIALLAAQRHCHQTVVGRLLSWP